MPVLEARGQVGGMIGAVAVAPGLVLFGEGATARTARPLRDPAPESRPRPTPPTAPGQTPRTKGEALTPPSLVGKGAGGLGLYPTTSQPTPLKNAHLTRQPSSPPSLSSPSPPPLEELASLTLPSVVQDIVYAEGRVYVAAGRAGLRILAVDPDGGLRELGAAALAGEARGVAVAGSLAYVAAELDGLRVVDVSNPAEPVEVGALNTGGRVTALAARPPYVYLADQNVTLRVVDASDPTAPVVVHTIADSALTTSLTVDGDRLLLATSHGLRVLSLADPAQPQETGRFPADRRYTLYAVAVAEGRVFVGHYQRGVEEFTVNAEGQPALACPACPDVYPDTSRANLVALAASDGLIYAADGDALTVLRYAPGPLRVVGTRPGFTQPGAVVLRGHYAYVAAPYQGVMTVDTQAAPRLSSRVEPQVDDYTPDLPDLAVVGERLAVAAGDAGVFQFSLADPARPALQGRLPLGVVDRVAGAGERLFAAGGSTVYSLRLDGSPALTATVALTQVHDLAASGDRVYVAGEGGLRVLRWPEGAEPVEVSCYRLPVAGRVAVAGAAIAVAHDAGVDVLTLPNPKGFFKPLRSRDDCQLQKLTTLVVPGRPLDIAALGDNIYVSDTSGQVTWVSLTQLAQPRQLAAGAAPGYPVALAADGWSLVVADAAAGLRLWRPTRARLWLPLVRLGD